MFDLRGAPSAISMAVIPQDHKSLCKTDNTMSLRVFFVTCVCSARVCSVCSYSVIVGSIWVLVTGDDLGGHPIGRADEGVPPPHCAIQLGAHAKVHCEHKAPINRLHGNALQTPTATRPTEGGGKKRLAAGKRRRGDEESTHRV